MKADNPDEITFFGETNFRNIRRRFGIKTDDRRRHMYLIGKTGTGKSTALENMIIQDIKVGRGVAVIDPLGDTIEHVIDFIPSYRVNDVIYFNPADLDYPIAFNVLENVDLAHRHLVSSGLIAVFKKIWVDSWGPRLEYVLRNAILSLLEYPGSTLLGVTRILVDDKYRNRIIAKVTDPIVKAFWLDEYTAYSNQFRTEAVAPIQNKGSKFLSSSVIRNIVGQPKSTIDMRDIMDNGKILLMNLAKGRIGEDNSSLLGAMMITKLQLAAMSRIDILEDTRRDFYLYVDEFQNFATESFATILSEARKYHLNLIIAHQYIEQLDETVSAAVFGNVGTLVSFRVGATDAEFLEKEFAPVFTETDLVNLAKYNVYLKLMIDGVASEPFSAKTLPPLSGMEGNREKIIAISRERYAKPRSQIEDKITRWTGVDEMQNNLRERPNFNNKPKGREGFRNNKIIQPVSPSSENIQFEKPEIPQPISLTEALKQPPVQFTRTNNPKPRPIATNQRTNEYVVKSKPPVNNQNVPPPENGPGPTTIKPNQEVRFDY